MATGYIGGDPAKVDVAGDTMTGPLVLPDGSPAASQEYVAENGGEGGGGDPAGTAATLVAAHSADTTAVHGITDTSALVLTGDARLSDARTPTSHVHAAADVNSGTLDVARLPTGTSGTTVALGNHTHAAAYQPLDADLTTLAGLTATTDNVVQSVGSAWASRTPAQLKSTLALAVADVSGAAPLASPTFTGTPAAPTAAAGTNTTQIATTAHVKAADDQRPVTYLDTAGTYAVVTGSRIFIGATTPSSPANGDIWMDTTP